MVCQTPGGNEGKGNRINLPRCGFIPVQVIVENLKTAVSLRQSRNLGFLGWEVPKRNASICLAFCHDFCLSNDRTKPSPLALAPAAQVKFSWVDAFGTGEFEQF